MPVCVCLFFGLFLSLANPHLSIAHEGPDPMVSWVFEPSFVDGTTVKSQQGPNLTIHGAPSLTAVGDETIVRLDGRQDFFQAEGDWEAIQAALPSQAMTIACWVSVDQTQPNGGIVSALQDNGNKEYGWVLGYNENNFTFGVSTVGADDGDGVMTYLAGSTSIELGKWHHVVASYDGQLMQLWIDGQLDGESNVQNGAILYPLQARLAVGAYLDDNEQFLHHGRLGSVVIYDVAAQPKWVTHDFEHQAQWTQLPAEKDPSSDFKFLVKPYLQFGTVDSMRVLCELTKPGKVTVEFGETSDFGRTKEAVSEDGLLHAALLDGLQPETGYYYQVVVREQDAGQELRGEVLSFQTASPAGRPFSFCVVGDTQGNPEVNGTIAQMAWALRPNFLVLPGDLVDDGMQKQQWIHEFFESMNPLISRVPLYPVLGNHERNADHYYRYMDLPAPEYYYTFRYGNAAFFMLDSNKKLGPESEQYVWLQKQLSIIEEERSKGMSDVVWKFVSFHHPIYSSDENDYGDLWKGKSTWGDLRLRPLTALFDRYGMDVVWNGHIHSYERTWQLQAGEAVGKGGTTYLVTGGGGGGLEQAGP
ncbi:MAG: LamG-like jellyroll fold domain-containing protein, partial [Aureliella sp.]